jgi:hypothetical protein
VIAPKIVQHFKRPMFNFGLFKTLLCQSIVLSFVILNQRESLIFNITMYHLELTSESYETSGKSDTVNGMHWSEEVPFFHDVVVLALR